MMRSMLQLLSALAISALAGIAGPKPASAEGAPAPSLPPPSLSVSREVSGDVAQQLAGDMADRLRTCEAKPDGQKLACFELMATTLSPTLGNGTSIGAWNIEAGDGRNLTAGLGSSHFITTDDSFPGHAASLFVRCQDGQVQVYVALGSIFVPKGVPAVGASVYFDDNDNPTHTDEWVPSKTGTAAGMWSTDTARGMAAQVFRSKHLAVSFAMSSGKFLRADFDTAGASTALASLNQTCGPW